MAVLGSLRPLEGGYQFTVTRLHVFFPQEMYHFLFFSFLANMIFPPCFINKFEQNHQLKSQKIFGRKISGDINQLTKDTADH